MQKGAVSIEKVTFATICILDRHESAYVVGVDLARKGDDDFETYGSMSLYLPKSEYPSVRLSLISILAEVFKHIPPDEEGVCFRSTIMYFRDNYHRLKLKAGVFAAGRSISFRHLRISPRKCMKLATDAAKRGSSLVEMGGININPLDN